MSEPILMNVKRDYSYSIVFDKAFLSVKNYLADMKDSVKSVLIITDSNVGNIYLDSLKDELKDSFNVLTYCVDAGEASKALEVAKNILIYCEENNLTRSDVIIALGGGVVGDLSGFVASVYKRGVKFINIPTSLLAMVDSSIGGKTAVDFNGYKNLIGSFYMPSLVIIDSDFLSSLPEREFYAGFAEVMKAALIKDSKFYVWLIDNMYEICDKDPEILTQMIEKAVSIKKYFVDKDPFENNIRAILNLGHTVGHAIEATLNGEYIHGECVALGCVAAAYISWKKEMISMEVFYEIRDMFVPFNLPISIVTDKVDDILNAVYKDKKVVNGKLNFILLKGIGRGVICDDVSKELIRESIENLNFKDED